MVEFTFISELRGNPGVVARDLLSLRGVNDELAPWIRMSAPRGWEQKPLSQWPRGEGLFVSWISLFGLIPVGRHLFGMESVAEDGFQEQSSSVLIKEWRHCRRVEPGDNGCRVTDEVKFTPRLPGLAILQAPIYRAVFRWRHSRLRSRYPEAGNLSRG